jgi:hypothetical protein
MLCEISKGGIVAYCSDLLVEPEEKEHVYFLSVAGYQTAVKGILANLVENEVLTIRLSDNTHWIKRQPGSYLLKTKKLPSGYCHGIAIPKIALPGQDDQEQNDEFLLIGSDSEELLPLFYRYLETKTEIPMHPSWASWLWQLFKKEDWLVKLETLVGRYQGFLASMNTEVLQEKISQAIKRKTPEIVNCLKPQLNNMEGAYDCRDQPQKVPR